MLTGHSGRVASVAIAPDGSWLAVTGQDGRLRIQDRRTGAMAAPAPTPAR
ncbi:hypothetical protein GCM10010495_19080 [Kitasatospora herbaricolor]|nr:WD40 repeat domain-containing protein [Kitasatospora herbaricolor]MDQ0308354.1 WD40 repeat protein [Kitasatospora herbaricolor]GGV06870.1 hypothetical protein GCM10010495_19080 [Kitasatospora herbaricolor]